MNKKLLAIGIVLVFLVVGLSGCTSSDKDKFVGSWQNNLGIRVYTFRDDGTYRGTATEGTYRLESGKIICESYGGYTVAYHYSFSNNGKTLMLEGIGTSSFTLTKVN